MASKSGQDAASIEQIEELLNTVDSTLDRLKTLYEQYFLGIQKQAPAFIHNDVERKLRDLTQINIRNTGLRYRLATLQQKFGSYNSYWRRTLRQIENGTYARNLAKIGREAARTGSDIPEEILAAMPKRMREQVLRDRDQALAIAKRREQVDDSGLTLADDEPVQIADAPKRDVKTASGAHVLSDDDGDIDFNAMFAAFDDDAPKTFERGRKISTMPPIARPQMPRMPTPASPAPSSVAATPPSGTASAQSPGQPPSSTPSTGIPRPVGQQPSAPATARPAGQPPSSTPGAGIPRPVGQQPSTPANVRFAGQTPSTGTPRVPGQPPGSTPSTGVPRAVGQQPSSETGAVPRAAAQTPSGPVHATGPVPIHAPQTATSAIPIARVTPPAGIPRPQTGPSPTVTQPIPRPAPGDASRPIPAIPAPPPRPQTGPTPMVTQPIPRPAPSQQSRPIPVMPGAAAQTGPVAVESMAGPFAREQATPKPTPTAMPKPTPTAMPKPTPQAMPKPTQQAMPKPTPQATPKPPLKPPPGMTDADVNALHAKYVKAKEAIGEKVDAGSREKLLKTINQTAPKIMEQYKASGVDFSVVVKDNQVVIKAKPKT